MKMKHLFALALFAVAGLFASQDVVAQIVLSGTSYSQNFDSVTTSGLPPGWNVYSTASATGLGNVSTYRQTQTNWSQTSALWFNMASLTNADGSTNSFSLTTAQQSNTLNRVVGVRQTGTANTGGDPGAAVAVEFNDTTIGSSFNVSFDWLLLSDQGRNTIWELDYGLGSSPTLFTKVAQWTNGGFLPSQTNLTYIGVTNLSFSLGSALDNQNQPVWFRVSALSATTGSGSRCTFGIDNFNLSWGPPITVSNAVVITNQPHGSTNNAGSTAAFTVGASGTAPTYQWYQVKGGNTNQLFDGAIGDGCTILGSTSPTLTLASVFGQETASYFVTVANNISSSNSALAQLSVFDPVISTQPFSQTNAPGDITYFTATVIGSQPVELQWYYNNTQILDYTTNAIATNTGSTIFITNGPTWTNASPGFYLIATNSYGAATSSIATTTVPPVPSTLITRWDFNSNANLSTTAPASSVGTGTGMAVTAGTQTNFLFTSGALNDPLNLTLPLFNTGWEVQSGPPQGTLNKQVGFQYNTSTVGYKDIYLTWSERHSATASKYMRVQYSTDGTTFQDGPFITVAEVAYDFYSANLSGITGINNNANFAFRIVMETEGSAINNGNTNYVGSTGTYGPGNSGGTIRNDLVTVWGNVNTAPITLNIGVTNSIATLSWTASGVSLQSAPVVTGTYTNVPGASSGYTTPVSNSKQLFFRLKAN